MFDGVDGISACGVKPYNTHAPELHYTIQACAFSVFGALLRGNMSSRYNALTGDGAFPADILLPLLPPVSCRHCSPLGPSTPRRVSVCRVCMCMFVYLATSDHDARDDERVVFLRNLRHTIAGTRVE